MPPLPLPPPKFSEKPKVGCAAWAGDGGESGTGEREGDDGRPLSVLMMDHL